MAVLILLKILLLFFLLRNVQSSEYMISPPGCPDSCGGIPIPYPFGVGPGCSLSDDFSVRCETSSWSSNRKKIGTATPYLRDLEILNISLPLSQARLSVPIFSQCYNTTTEKDQYSQWEIDTVGTPLWLNNEKNNFIVTGCNTFATLTLYDLIGRYSEGCLSTCDNVDSLNKYGPSCSGIGCCQTDILKATKSLNVTFDERYNHSLLYNFSRCSYAMVVENAGFVFNTTSITTDDGQLINNTVPAVFDWVIKSATCKNAQTNKSTYACKSSSSVCLNSINSRGYLCNCSDGYQGNPYLEGGCQDIDECAAQNPCLKPSKCQNLPGGYRCSCPFGRRHNSDTNICELNWTLILGLTLTLACTITVIVRLLYFAIPKIIEFFEKRKQEKSKHAFFVQNGGEILKHQILGYTIFTLDELDKATNGFDKALIVGKGGSGEVYKGILPDKRVVAIKRANNFNLGEIKQFINEVAILLQVRHRNVVQLIGCCLETEVPLLVYEFISNGTLYDHLYTKESCSLTWKQRLKIALDVAIAINHCHSELPIRLIHRDLKTSNILLDDNFTAKVSDFGVSTILQDDETGLHTLVCGTYGYLDPEYLLTGRLTEKCDVYSFGVILVELLTRQKPIISSSVEGVSLAAYFVSALNENRLFEILDPQVVDEGNTTVLEAVAKLARKCLRDTGEERPTMTEVVGRLKTLWVSNEQQKHYKNKNWWRQGKRIVAQFAKRGEEP